MTEQEKAKKTPRLMPMEGVLLWGDPPIIQPLTPLPLRSHTTCPTMMTAAWVSPGFPRSTRPVAYVLSAPFHLAQNLYGLVTAPLPTSLSCFEAQGIKHVKWWSRRLWSWLLPSSSRWSLLEHVWASWGYLRGSHPLRCSNEVRNGPLQSHPGRPRPWK